MSSRNSQVLQGQKRRRRQWLTFIRMIRYGINNFSRNAWLTVAATAVMTITLVIFFATMAAQKILADSVDIISNKVDMSIYLKANTTAETARPVIDALQKLSNVKSVQFISSEDARALNAEKSKNDNDVLDAINEATNKLPATLRVSLKNINDTSELDTFVTSNTELKKLIHPERRPSFSGDRRVAIQQIASWTVLAQRIGLTASAVFIAVSSLIIFNTIRMAIFSRKEEIQMMKLIGANKSFIRGPFIVEAIVYGFIAAILATALGFALLLGLQTKLNGSGIVIQPTIDAMIGYIGFVVLAMIVIGACIGIVSSLLATRRYLKI
jgi:cell division transport system permease protein